MSGSSGIEPSMIFFTIATLVDRSSSWTGPNTATGLIEQNAMPGACIATQSRAARSATVLLSI